MKSIKTQIHVLVAGLLIITIGTLLMMLQNIEFLILYTACFVILIAIVFTDILIGIITKRKHSKKVSIESEVKHVEVKDKFCRDCEFYEAGRRREGYEESHYCTLRFDFIPSQYLSCQQFKGREND
jgi:hypothetical protein